MRISAANMTVMDMPGFLAAWAGAPFGNADDIFAHFSDIFGDIFGFGGMGGSAQANRPQAGASLRYSLKLSLSSGSAWRHRKNYNSPSGNLPRL